MLQPSRQLKVPLRAKKRSRCDPYAVRDEDREFWVGGPKLRGDGWRPWLVSVAIIVGLWLALSLAATLIDSDDGLTFLLP
jgi:hypothetical protein